VNKVTIINDLHRLSGIFSLKLKHKGIFTDRMIFNLVFPIMLQQSVYALAKVANTAMVAYVGQTAVAGVSVVTTVDNLINSMINALAIGGAVVISQYIGMNDLEKGCAAVKNSFYIIVIISTSVSLILLSLRVAFLRLLTGAVEAEVFQNALVYFTVVLLSYPFYAMFYFASAVFRAMCKTKIVSLCTVGMSITDLALKAVFLRVLDMGVFGAGLSTLISSAAVSLLMIVLVCSPINKVYIKRIFHVKLDFEMIKRVLGIGVPNSVENGMFQFGLLALQRLAVSFGTASLAANAIIKELCNLSNIIPTSYRLSALTIVGQCMGAGEKEQAVMYINYIVKVNYILGLIFNAACIIIANPLIGLFSMPQEVNEIAFRIFIVYCAGSILFYPLSFVLPDALRGAGDTKYTMLVSTVTMFSMRICMAFVLGRWFGLGILGLWLAMQLDWICRSILFTGRFLRGKWKNIKVI